MNLYLNFLSMNLFVNKPIIYPTAIPATTSVRKCSPKYILENATKIEKINQIVLAFSLKKGNTEKTKAEWNEGKLLNSKEKGLSLPTMIFKI